MFEEKGTQQCPFLKAFGCDGVMVNQVALLTLVKILAAQLQLPQFLFLKMKTLGVVPK